MPPLPSQPPQTIDPSLAFICESPRPEGLSTQFSSCANCHGDNGDGGGVNVNLAIAYTDFDAFEDPIRNGRGSMPAFSANIYSDEVLRNDLAYLAHPSLCSAGGSSSASSVSSSSSSATSLASSSSSVSSSTGTVEPGEAPVTEGPEGAFSFCVNEAEWHRTTPPEPNLCEFEGTREVYFGANGQFHSAVATGSIACTSESFGGDPIRDTRKACFVSNNIHMPGTSSASSAVSSSSSTVVSSSSSAASSSSSSASSEPDFVCDAPKPEALSSHYTGTCRGCHGPSGEGGFGPELTNYAFLEQYETPIRMGTPHPNMRAYPESDYPQSSLLNDFAFFNYDHRCNNNAQQLSTNACDLDPEAMEPRLIPLSETQLLNTLSAVFEHFNASALSAEQSTTSLDAFDQAALEHLDLEQWQTLQTTLSGAVTQLSNALAQDCDFASESNCSEWLLAEYAPQLWRRPVSTDELLELSQAVSGADLAEQISSALQSLLISTNFVFRTEMATEQQPPGLDAYEIASRLSYTLWHSSPDAVLYELAASGQLSEPSIINEQVERMIADARFQGSVEGLISSEFLTLEEMLDPNKQLYGLGIEAPSDQACRVDWQE